MALIENGAVQNFSAINPATLKDTFGDERRDFKREKTILGEISKLLQELVEADKANPISKGLEQFLVPFFERWMAIYNRIYSYEPKADSERVIKNSAKFGLYLRVYTSTSSSAKPETRIPMGYRKRSSRCIPHLQKGEKEKNQKLKIDRKKSAVNWRIALPQLKVLQINWRKKLAERLSLTTLKFLQMKPAGIRG